MKKYYITSRTFNKKNGWSDWINIGLINSNYPHFVFKRKEDAEHKLEEMNKFSRIDEDLGIYYEYKLIEQDI